MGFNSGFKGLTVSVCGMVDWLMYNGGQIPFRRVKVIFIASDMKFEC